jgi:predicted nucleic acid-binding protein
MKPMHDNAFFDTNVVLYLYSKDEIRKQSTSLRIVNECAQAIISTQVVNELINVLSKKIGLEWDEITNVLAEIRESFTIHIVNLTVIQSACKFAKRYQYSYFDSLIIASALASNATVLFSEDMQNGQIIESRLTIINPYL